MKNKTKQNLLIGGAAIAGIYILMRGGEKVEGGGFGGGGGIPLLPGDTEGAAESDTIINYILGGETSPFAGFDDVEPKKAATTITTDKLGAPITTDPQALPVDTGFVFDFMKESGFLLPGETKDDLGVLLTAPKKVIHAPLSTSHHQIPSIQFGHVLSKKASIVSLEKEAAVRNQKIVWDTRSKKQSLTPGQLSISRESAARGQTVVYD